MLLGTILEQLSDEAFALQTMTDLGDLTLLARLSNAAEEQDLALGAVIRRAVSTFIATADADSWVQLLSTINRSENPGGAALKMMLENSLPR